jgi:LAS superfamily LD-carboxypeptidase LdcB
MVQAIGGVGTLTARDRYGLIGQGPGPGTPFRGQPAAPGATAFAQTLAKLNPAGAQASQASADLANGQQLAQSNELEQQRQQLLEALRKQQELQQQREQGAPGQGDTFQGGGNWQQQVQQWEHQYKNGYIPQNQLTLVHGFRVSSLIAGNLNNLLNAAQKAGVWNGRDAWATGTYRDYATQVRLYDDWIHGRRSSPAAKPGTSLHGWGLAIDFNNSNAALIRWLHANASRFGLYNLPGEPWHYSVNGH